MVQPVSPARGDTEYEVHVSVAVGVTPIVEIHCAAYDYRIIGRDVKSGGDNLAARYTFRTEFGIELDARRSSLGRAVDIVYQLANENPEYWPPFDTDVITQALINFRTPVFGTPPESFEKLGKLIEKGSSVAISGYFVETGHPVLAVATSAGTFIYWMAKPSAKIARRKLSQKVAKAMHTTVRPEDYE